MIGEIVRDFSMKGIFVCHAFVNININEDLEVSGTVKIRTFDITLDVNHGGRCVNTDLVTVAH
jgi:hypothetical protein